MVDTVFDRVVRHQIQIERVKSGEVKRINEIISKNDSKILAILAAIPDDYTQIQLEAALESIRLLNKTFYNEVVKSSLDSVAKSSVSFETDFATETVEKFLDKELPTKRASKAETLDRTLKTKYEGHKLSTWTAKLATDKTKRIAGQVKMSASNQESVEKMVSSAKKAMRTANSNNQSVTKAYVNQSVNFSRDDVYKANDDKVQEIIWSSILDSGTTITCGVRSNKRYEPVTKKPIGHDNLWNGGPGLIHWNCRSLAIPVDKDDVITSGTGEGYVAGSGSKTAIGAEEGYERGGNKKDDGKRYKTPSVNNELERESVSAKTDYETWLKRQPRAFVEDSIGVAKADAFLSGKAELGDFVVPSGRELTVKQLEETINLDGNNE